MKSVRAHWREPTAASQAKGRLPNFHRPFGHGDGFAFFDGGFGFLHKGGDHGGELVLGEELAFRVSEFFAPVEVVGEHGFEIFTGADLDDGFVEGLGGAEAFGVPRSDFAEHHAAAVFAEDFDHQIVMPTQHADSFFKGRSGQKLAGFDGVLCVFEKG